VFPPNVAEHVWFHPGDTTSEVLMRTGVVTLVCGG
jgi:hypothetical protein